MMADSFESILNSVTKNDKLVQYGSLAALAVASAVLIQRLQARGKSPPGPTPLPVVGNWFDYPGPDDEPWLKFLEWTKKYKSDIISLNVWGTKILVLNSHQATADLLHKKQFNDRPEMPMINDLMGLHWHFGFMHNDDERWKQDRQLFNREYNPVASQQFRDLTYKWTNILLQNLLDRPEEFMYHAQHMASGNSAESIFGLQVQPADKPDPFIGVAQQAVGALIKATLFGSYFVDFMPIVKYLPGLGFKRTAKQWRGVVDTAITLPLDLAKGQISDGTAPPSIVHRLLKEDPKNEDSIRRMSTVAFAQGSAAFVSTLQTFFLHISQNPDVQEAAQAQLDTVLKGRLPTIDDQASLPFITAIIKEVLRMGVVAPLAFPHRLTTDEVYQGYYLAAGSVVIPNTWAILRDPVAYPDPDKFRPERFLTLDGRLDEGVRDPDVAAFGYGHRKCPGRHFAMDELFLTTASILALFSITDGPQRAAVPYNSGFLRYPSPFKCTIRPRNERCEASIRSLSS